MSKQLSKTLVPKLRFPEFQNVGEWEERKLEEVASFSKGKGISKSDVTADGKQPCIRYGELYTHYNETIENVNSYTNISANNLVLNKANDVIIPASGETQEDIATASCVMKGGIALGGDLNIISSKMNGVFLSYYLNSAKKYSIAQMSQGISVVHLYSSQLKNLDISIPDILEQQKIADCLSSIDELITAHSQKHEALKNHKKGLMQQLFPAEGETVPKLRFPEFRDAGEWEDKLFGNIIKIKSGKGFKAAEYSNIGIRLLQIENVGYGVTKWNENTIFLPNTYADEYPELVLRKGDIVLALNRPVTNNELKIARIQKDDDPSILYQRVGKVELIKDFLIVDFAFQICQQFIKDFVIKKSIGSDQPFISLRDLYAQTIQIPNTEEQQKIADCLSSIDELITAQSQKIETLKAHKKGLMQQLFPATDDDCMDAGGRATQDAKAEVGA